MEIIVTENKFVIPCDNSEIQKAAFRLFEGKKRILFLSSNLDDIKRTSGGFEIDYPYDLEGEFTLVEPITRTEIAEGILIVNRPVENNQNEPELTDEETDETQE